MWISAARWVTAILLVFVLSWTAGCGGSKSIPDAAAGETAAGDSSASKKVSSMAGADPIAQIRSFIAEKKIDFAKDTSRRSLPKPPMLSFDPKTDYFWNLETNKGNMVIKLWPDVAPMHVSSTLYLVESGFYDGIRFHRVINGFMAQGGCPMGTGTGSPGYSYDSEFKPGVEHTKRGLLSMANTGRPTSDGSQFFLTFVPTPNLDGKHTLFGEIVEGLETLDELEACGSPSGTPTTVLTMTKSTITTRPK